KVEVAAERLREVAPALAVESRTLAVEAGSASALSAYPVWIDATDGWATKLALSDLAVRERRTLVHAGAVRLGGQLLAIVPGRGPCLRCLLADEGEEEASCRRAGILGPVVGVLGSLLALFALRALQGEDVAGRLVTFDAATGALRDRTLPRRPDCAVCAGGAIAEADVTADVCPMTFVRARLVLERLAPGDRLGVLLRGEEPLANLPRSFQEEGHRVLSIEPRAGGRHYLLVEKSR
ncbi:MAG TPA: ThiF family adenylyltransferase, partial [Myxococcales bacterium]|nr:ThiF family adenylyltransferase [Myxococcales bacterium]